MDSVVVLMRCITLLYRESQLPPSSNDSKELVKEVCDYIKSTDSVDIDRSRDAIRSLKDKILALCARDTHVIPVTGLLQDVKLACYDRDDIFTTFKMATSEELTDQDLTLERNQYIKELTNYLQHNTFMSKFNELYKSLRMSNQFNYTEKLISINELIEPVITGEMLGRTTQESDLILSNIKSLSAAFEMAAIDDNPKLYLKVGWQWLTEMLGEPGAFKRGDQVLFYALQHGYKSGFTMNIFRQCIQYNPNFRTLNENRKPLMIHLSTENHLTDNLKFLYQMVKENETGEVCSMSGLDRDAAAEYLSKWAGDLGWSVAILRRNPTEFTFRDICALVNSYEAQGYEVVGFFIDYLAMCSTRGCWTGQGGGTGMDIRALFRKCRNFFAEKHILSFTPHQLSTEAKRRLQFNDGTNFLPAIVNQGLTDSCGTLDQEADVEIYGHIIKNATGSYYHTHRGKHRGVNNTAQVHFEKIVPFQEVAGLPDDIGKSRAIPRIPGSNGAEVMDW